MADIVVEQIRPRLARIAAIVNPRAGSVGGGAAEALARQVANYGGQLSIACPEPDDMEQAIRAEIAREPDLVVVLAGDGTARMAASLCGPAGPLVAPLPGGTMNMLPHALYGALDWPEALDAALGRGVERQVSGGRVNGEAFYVAAILGAPALWGLAREAVRRGDLIEATRRVRYALRRAFTGELRYGLDGAPGRRAEALVVMTPLISRVMRDETPSLEAAALSIRGAKAAFRLALSGAFGDWREDPGVTASPCGSGWAAARRSIPAILDGEVRRLPRRVEFAFEPTAFRALAPLREAG